MAFRKNLILTLTLLFFSTVFSQTSYTPDPLLRGKIKNEIWEDLKKLTPEKHQVLISLIFNGNVIFDSYEKTVAKKGLPKYGLPTVQSFFKVLCREVVTDKQYTDAEMNQEYEVIKKHYARTGKDLKLSNVEKQRKYDPLILKAVWVASLYEFSKKNSPEIQNLARQLLENNNVSIENQGLTETLKPTIQEDADTKKINSPETISNIILRTVTSYGLSGVYITNEVNILYKNGDVFTNPSKPLETYNIGESKKKQPKKWDKWRKQGNVIYVTRSKNGKVYDWKKWFNVRPGTKGFKLNGKFNTSDAFGGAAVINASTVYFDNQGRFAWKTVKGGNTVWKPVFVKNKTAGTYHINKHTMTLNYNNGVSESFFFGLYPKDNKHFIIGTNHFVPIKNK